MLRARVITAVCALAAIFLVLFVLPPVVVSPVILLVITGAAWEWSRLAGLEAALPRATYILGIAAMPQQSSPQCQGCTRHAVAPPQAPQAETTPRPRQ
ncbi:MAG: hypothetical protein AAFV30_06870 [Pseudomonadota bacterium]